jgi:signal transduction histidine kinase/ABC-type multidrug transport system ATPase subunit
MAVRTRKRLATAADHFLTRPGSAAGKTPGSQGIDAAPLLHVEDLGVSYGSMRALHGVNVDIHQGQIVAVAGENGAGKSTLVRCIAGDMAPSRGRILLSGRRLPPNPALVSRWGVAVVWQDLALCANLDVAANLMLGAEPDWLMLSETRFHALAARRLRELHIPLPDSTRLVADLSGGQRQLLAVARAMLDHPQLLVLDEPTASLGVVEAAQVEDLTLDLRRQGTTILLVSHDIDQMFRLADRIVVLRHGRVVADVDPAKSHPDEVAGLLSGQEIDSSPRRQLSRLHGLADRLASADPSSSLSLILSALGAALGTEQLYIHLVEGSTLRAAASLGLPAAFIDAWSNLPLGPAGGPVGIAADQAETVIDRDVRTSAAWAPFVATAQQVRIGSSWSLPVTGSVGVLGVITVFRPGIGIPDRDELDLVTLYARYAANALERDRLLSELTARNRVLETIREILETLAGPVPLVRGLSVALHALRDGLQADEVALVTGGAGQPPRCRAVVGGGSEVGEVHRDSRGDGEGPGASPRLLGAAAAVLAQGQPDGQPRLVPCTEGGWHLAVTFLSPSGPTALVAGWANAGEPPDGSALLGDAAHSLRLALEREESERAHQETTALRRSQELQRQFLSRLSHELRTPLTAIRGYASSLMQSDVIWDGASQDRFLTRIGAESARLGRLVDDLLDFSAIEANILRIQPDWCDLSLVLDAARGCLPPTSATLVSIVCPPHTPVVWADHDRLEQVFVNLLDNALRHNPPGTLVDVSVSTYGADQASPRWVSITVTDNGDGVPDEMVTAAFEPYRVRRRPTSGAGLGLSIAQGIIEAHGGHIDVQHRSPGTQFVIHLPIEVAPTETLHDD